MRTSKKNLGSKFGPWLYRRVHHYSAMILCSTAFGAAINGSEGVRLSIFARLYHVSTHSNGDLRRGEPLARLGPAVVHQSPNQKMGQIIWFLCQYPCFKEWGRGFCDIQPGLYWTVSSFLCTQKRPALFKLCDNTPIIMSVFICNLDDDALRFYFPTGLERERLES